MRIKIGNLYGIDFILEDQSIKRSKRKTKKIIDFYKRAVIASENLLNDDKFISFHKL